MVPGPSGGLCSTEPIRPVEPVKTTARSCYKAHPVRRILAMTSRAGACLAGLTFTALALLFGQVSAQGTPQTITVTSPTVKEGQPVPRQHTPDGRNDSPALSWSGVPSSARSLMVFCEDPDVGNPPPFVHWVVYNIPADRQADFPKRCRSTPPRRCPPSSPEPCRASTDFGVRSTVGRRRRRESRTRIISSSMRSTSTVPASRIHRR